MNYYLKWILQNTLGRIFPFSKYHAWNYNPTEIQEWWIEKNLKENPELQGFTYDEHGHKVRIGDNQP